MFGYVTVNRPELKVKDLELYRSYYCGLCAQLRRRYGRMGQLLLSYDCTFLTILLTGLYEPEEEVKMRRCIVHPAVVHRETSNRFTEYAADMNVLLGYMKAADDWLDEKKGSARLETSLLRRGYLEVKEKYPRQEKAVRVNVQKLRRDEKLMRKEPGSEELTQMLLDIDRMAGYTGAFLGEIYAAQDDMWADGLRKTGFYLGKFIYLIDAYDDMEKDKKDGNVNVLSELQKIQPDDFDGRVKEMLLDTAACCCRAFERLPIIKNAAVLRNILYSGIWVRYHRIAGDAAGDGIEDTTFRGLKRLRSTPAGAQCGGEL